ncbi:MAG: FlgD immunoglobulin-like domain containing protein [Gemmatimonadota bacterium]
MRIYRYLLLVLGLAGAPVAAQTARLVPSALSAVPKGATAANPYWQHLVIDLTRPPSAGNTITINLPAGVAVADVNGNASVADDISLDGVPDSLTGYSQTTGSTSSRIVLSSPTGGKRGPVHVQFPITTAATPAAAATVYGVIAFANGSETAIPAGSVSLTFVEAYDLSLVTYSSLFRDGQADTTTSRAGEAFPDTGAAAFAVALPQLVSDRHGTLGSATLSRAGAAFGNGQDADDVVFRFWLSTSDSLTAADTTTAKGAVDRSTGALAEAYEGGQATPSFDVSGLAVGTYYLYVTTSVTGTHPVARSRGIRVRHDPTVVSVGRFEGDSTDYIDSGLLLNFDSGAIDSVARARDAVDIPFRVLDLDTTAAVYLFYAAADTLDSAQVTTSGTSPNRTVTGLSGGARIDSARTLVEGVDSVLTWDPAPTDTSYVAAGDYYVYAVVTDGARIHVGRSARRYAVRHSPFLGFDARPAATLTTGGSRPDRYHAITWNRDRGIDGDVDRDDSATISLYYSDADSFRVPGGAQQLASAAADTSGDTHRIVGGLSEDDDGREDNQYSWDLWTYRNPDDGGVPAEGKPYYLYGIIAGGGTERIVRWDLDTGGPGALRFAHPSHLALRAPTGPVQVDGRRSFEVAWDAVDVDDRAGLWVLLVPEAVGHDLGDSTTYGQLVAAGSDLWVATSDDGSLAAGTPAKEDSVSSLAVRPSRLVRNLSGAAAAFTNGTYFAYVVIDTGATVLTAGAAPAAPAQARRAPGLVTVTGLPAEGATGLEAPAFEVLAAHQAIESQGDTARLELRPNAGGREVDVISVFLSIDTSLVAPVDQDTGRAGMQPFRVDPALAGLTLADTAYAGADSANAGRWLLDLVYFQQAGSAAFDGGLTLATLPLAARGREGGAILTFDRAGDRQSGLFRRGSEVAPVAPGTAARIDVRPRGSLSGRLQLQGRTTQVAVATFQLRDRNSFAAIADSVFAAANDADTAAAGIQDTLDAEGRFTLSQVPSGDYHLAVHVDRYLDGQYPFLRVHPGVAATGVDPTFLADGVTQSEFLLGGDVTGYVDTSGASSPDNQVDQLDVDFVVSHFGQSITPTHAGRLADIDGDSLVWVPDLNMVAANFGDDGVEPVYRPAAPGGVPGEPELRLVKSAMADGGLRVVVLAETGEPVRAFGLHLRYGEGRVALRGLRAGEGFGARPSARAERLSPGEVWVGSALMGAQVGLAGEVTLAELVFDPVVGAAAAADPDLAAEAEFVDRWHRRLGPVVGAARPAALALLPSYPNPFNPATLIRFDLPEGGVVQVAVYDAAGQLVRSLVSEWRSPGRHELTWDGRGDDGRPVASGAYFVHLAAGGAFQVRKVMLLK